MTALWTTVAHALEIWEVTFIVLVQ